MAQFFDLDSVSGQLRPGDQYCMVFTQEQMAVLQDAFQRNMSPEEQEIKELASRLQIKHQVVQMWFHYQRDQLQTQQRNHQMSSSLAALRQGKGEKRTSSKQASREMGASCNQATRVRIISSNQGTSETGASSRQDPREKGTSFPHANRGRRASSSQEPRGMSELSNQPKPESGAPDKQGKSLTDDEIPAAMADYDQLLSPRASVNSNLQSQQNFGEKPPDEVFGFAAPSQEHSELLEIYQTSLGLVQPPSASQPYDIDTLVNMYSLPGDDDPTRFDKYFYLRYFD